MGQYGDYYDNGGYDADYQYGEGYYDEDLQAQIAQLQNYYDMNANMDQYQRAYNQQYMNLMNAYNRLLQESNMYTANRYYDGMNQMGRKASPSMQANAYNAYDNEYAL